MIHVDLQRNTCLVTSREINLFSRLLLILDKSDTFSLILLNHFDSVGNDFISNSYGKILIRCFKRNLIIVLILFRIFRGVFFPESYACVYHWIAFRFLSFFSFIVFVLNREFCFWWEKSYEVAEQRHQILKSTKLISKRRSNNHCGYEQWKL